MTIRVSPRGTHGARVPTLLVKLIGKWQLRTYRRSGEGQGNREIPVVRLTRAAAFD